MVAAAAVVMGCAACQGQSSGSAQPRPTADYSVPTVPAFTTPGQAPPATSAGSASRSVPSDAESYSSSTYRQGIDGPTLCNGPC